MQNFQPTEVTSSFHWGEKMQPVLSGRPLLLCTAVAMLRAYTLTSVVYDTSRVGLSTLNLVCNPPYHRTPQCRVSNQMTRCRWLRGLLVFDRTGLNSEFLCRPRVLPSLRDGNTPRGKGKFNEEIDARFYNLLFICNIGLLRN